MDIAMALAMTMTMALAIAHHRNGYGCMFRKLVYSPNEMSD